MHYYLRKHSTEVPTFEGSHPVTLWLLSSVNANIQRQAGFRLWKNPLFLQMIDVLVRIANDQKTYSMHIVSEKGRTLVVRPGRAPRIIINWPLNALGKIVSPLIQAPLIEIATSSYPPVEASAAKWTRSLSASHTRFLTECPDANAHQKWVAFSFIFFTYLVL